MQPPGSGNQAGALPNCVVRHDPSRKQLGTAGFSLANRRPKIGSGDRGCEHD